MNTKPTVFVIDDDQTVRTGLCRAIEALGLQTESFASAEDFLAAYEPARPGCLVTDLHLPGMSGIDLQAALFARHILLPVIVVSGHAAVDLAVSAMQHGAITFIEKPCREPELRNAIYKALDRDAETRQRDRRQQEVLQRLALLTQPERQVMDLMVTGMANKNIAQELDVSLRTVEARRRQVLKKMQTTTLAELVTQLFLVPKDQDRLR